MKKFYDFSKGKRGALVPIPPGKTRITIRLDNEVLDWFRDQVEKRGGGNYQTMINDALREHIYRDHGLTLEEAVRRALKTAFLETNLNNAMTKMRGLTATNYGFRNDILPFQTATSKSSVSEEYMPYVNLCS